MVRIPSDYVVVATGERQSRQVVWSAVGSPTTRQNTKRRRGTERWNEQMDNGDDDGLLKKNDEETIP